MQVLVISGFLGAGKTTFIRELITRTNHDFVIYENEYGQTDIDAQTLRNARRTGASGSAGGRADGGTTIDGAGAAANNNAKDGSGAAGVKAATGTNTKSDARAANTEADAGADTGAADAGADTEAANTEGTTVGTSNIEIYESFENCICCSGKQDFASSVLTISSALDPDYLIVEPTGIARLSSVLENIAQVSYERISLLAPLTIVDATCAAASRAQFPDIYDNQLHHAGTIVVSKLAGSSMTAHEVLASVGFEQARYASGQPGCASGPLYHASGQPDCAGEQLHRATEQSHHGGEQVHHASTCPIPVIDSEWHALPDSWFENLLRQPYCPDMSQEGIAVRKRSGHSHDHSAHTHNNHAHAHDELATCTLHGCALASPTQLIWLLDALVAGVFGSISRAKGLITCSGELIRFDVVGGRWAITGAADYTPASTNGQTGAKGHMEADSQTDVSGYTQTNSQTDTSNHATTTGNPSQPCTFIGNNLHPKWLAEAFGSTAAS